MPDAFVPMRKWLAPAPIEDEPSIGDVLPVLETLEEPLDDAKCDDRDRAISEARRFCAALGDALEVAVAQLTVDISAEIVARELLLQPCDIARIVERAIERYGEMPVRLRVHREDLEAARGRFDAVVDDELRPGDVILELRSGTIDATLGARLERVLTDSRA